MLSDLLLWSGVQIHYNHVGVIKNIYICVYVSLCSRRLKVARGTCPHWSNMIPIPRLKLALFLYNKKVEIYKTEFKHGKNNKIQ